MYLLIVIWHTAYNNIDVHFAFRYFYFYFTYLCNYYLTRIVHSKSKFKIVLNVVLLQFRY